MRAIIDRFEGDYAVCELSNGDMKSIPKSHIPNECCEGDLIFITHEKIIFDKAKSTEHRKSVEKSFEDMWE